MMIMEQKHLNHPLLALHEEAIALLKADTRQNALLIGRLLNGFAEDVGIYKHSVRLRDTRSGNYMFSVKNLEAFDRLFEEAETRPQIFFLSDDGLLAEMEARGFMPEPMYQWLMEDDAEMCPADPEFQFGPARLSDLDLISSVYKSEEFGREYLEDVIRDNLSVCAYSHGELAGFMLTHKDGETGPMVILDQYRKRGLGEQLARRISNMMRDAGVLPIGHIYPHNAISAHLHEAVGYRRCKRPVLWVYPGAYAK